MKKSIYGSVYVFIILIIGNVMIVAQTNMKPPIAKKVPKVLKIHGYEITDNYFWLRDRNEKKDPAIMDYLNAENTYTESFMNPHKAFTDKLYNEMIGRIKQTDLSVPYKLGDFWYYSKTEEGKQYPVYVRAETREGKGEQVLLDQNKLAEGFKYFSIGDFDVSEDGNFLAYSTDTTGYRQYVLQIKNLKTGEILPDRIERVTSTAWSNNGKYLFVVQEHEETKRSDKLFRHRVGTNENELLLEEKDPLFNIGVGKSRDNKIIFLGSYAKTSREYRFISADEPMDDWKIILPREAGHEYSVDHYGGGF